MTLQPLDGAGSGGLVPTVHGLVLIFVVLVTVLIIGAFLCQPPGPRR